MKSIEQLLFLSRNPYYPMTNDEKAVLDDFLSKKQEKTPKKSQKKSTDESSKKTNVIVRNVVQKADTYPPEDTESDSKSS